MRANPVAAFVVLLCLGVILGAAPHASGADPDPAARGLDMFLHAERTAPPGGTVPLQVQAIGFPSVTMSRPLAAATVEAAWDPQSLGPGHSTAPPSLSTKTDAAGLAHLDVPVPRGPSRTIQLLVRVRAGAHERTRTVPFQREPAYDVSIHVADEKVVPGSTVSAWILARKTATLTPAAWLPIELALFEGAAKRYSVRLRTDRAGSATGRVPIPLTDDPSWEWTLQASVTPSQTDEQGGDAVVLRPREETPGQPRLTASWTAPAMQPGGTAHYTIRVRDASDRPVANAAVRTWVGVAGTEPPEDEKRWNQVSTSARTNMAGELTGDAKAPSPVPPVVGTDMRVVVRTNVEGQDLASEASIHVGARPPSATFDPEGGSLVAGLEQVAVLRVVDGWDRPVTGTFSVEADGLSAKVSTNEEGEAKISWKPPADVGAHRDVGPCASGVAASVIVRPTEDLAALEHRRDPFSLCVPVQRDTPGMVRVDKPVVSAGDTIEVGVDGGSGLPWSIVLAGGDTLVATSAWMEDGAKGVKIRIPEGASGLMTLSALSPSRGDEGRAVGGAVLVRPRVLPILEVKVSGGRAAPGGKVYVDATLSDGAGRGLKGTVAALVFDLHGGGSAQGLSSLDTRTRLCRRIGIDDARCAAFLSEDPALDVLRRVRVGASGSGSAAWALDPGSEAEAQLREAFALVVRSLEGAVLEASVSPDRLRDVRRRSPGGPWGFNPELWTLVTAAIPDEPRTPGGEPFTLADLAAIDRQVEFNTVARRVTRLKLMRVLMRVREFVRAHYVDPDEPALADPAALLRRLVADEVISHADLLDPWGGSMQFVKSPGPHLPFLTIRGYRLQAPGPDGRLGTGDDVRDPFERVLRSKTPYAQAVGEDRLVDSRLDMQVSDETVAGWTDVMERLTGTSLGLSGTGEGGGGRGEGIGLGSIGTIGHGAGDGRGGFGITTDNVVWLPPARTDANGRVRLEVPLGDIETTWRVAMVAVPDTTLTAVATVDVPVALDLSARVEAGARWVVGDRIDTRVSLRNRTKAPAQATLAIQASGAVSLVHAADAQAKVTIPAMGEASVTVPLNAGREGTAQLRIRTTAAGLREDVLTHEWAVKPAGEPTRVTQTAWIEQRGEVALPPSQNRLRPLAPPVLVLERGSGPALESALRALDPDTLNTPEAQADALEVALRIRRWAVARGGEKDPLAIRASSAARRAQGRLSVYMHGEVAVQSLSSLRARVGSLGGPVKVDSLPEAPSCPPEGTPTLQVALELLEAEPRPVGGVIEACWDAYVTSATSVITESRDPVALARAVLAFAERRHRAALASSLANRLRERVKLTSAGWLSLPALRADDRASRAIVYAALIRATSPGDKKAVPVDRLAAWLAVQRDAYGGYGSSEATRLAVRAILSISPATAGPAPVMVRAGANEQEIQLDATRAVVMQLSDDAKVAIESSTPGILARLERKTLRHWSAPLTTNDGNVHIDVAWPTDAKAGRSSRLQVSLRHDLGRDTTIDARIPLPPGVALAAAMDGVRQVQGALVIRHRMDDSALPDVLHIPVRFGLSGTVTVPEAYARLAFEQDVRAIAPARPLVVK